MTRYAYPEGAFEVDTIPAQPQIAHCHGFFVTAKNRGKGNAHVLKKRQMNLLASEHYDYATATVDGSNAAQKKVLTKAGFRCLDTFINRKTCGVTELWGRSISTIQDK